MKDAFIASNYVHQEIAERLIERLDLIRLSPENIVVYGWQTASELALLKERYPGAEIQALSALSDLIALPENSVQLVVSNLALDWENEPKAVLAEFHRSLSVEGLLLFSTLGPDTGKELRQSFSVIDDAVHVHNFTDMHHIGDALKQLQFDDPVVDMEMLTLAYDQLAELFHDLKNTASTNADADRRKGLMTPSQLRQMETQYEACKTDDYYPFTLEIIYGHAWKVDKPKNTKQEVSIPISAIKK